MGLSVSQCPFCHASVPESLTRLGGRCPTCLGEIPGEEAPTDPGEERKAAQRQADQAQARKRQRGPLLVAVPAVLAVVAGVIWQIQQEPVLERLEFDADELGFSIDVDAFVADAGGPAPAEATPEAGVNDKPSRKGGRNRLADGAVAAAGVGGASGDVPVASDGSVEASGSSGGARTVSTGPVGGVRPLDGGVEASGSGSASPGLDVTFNTGRTASLLTEKEDIRDAVKAMFGSRKGRLVQCYERSLKVNEALAGTWKLSFTVGTDGALSEPSAVGVGVSDPALESCIAREMAVWRIEGRLKNPLPVTIPMAFGEG